MENPNPLADNFDLAPCGRNGQIQYGHRTKFKQAVIFYLPKYGRQGITMIITFLSAWDFDSAYQNYRLEPKPPRIEQMLKYI